MTFIHTPYVCKFRKRRRDTSVIHYTLHSVKIHCPHHYLNGKAGLLTQAVERLYARGGIEIGEAWAVIEFR
jgi:hypothetical protein